MPTVRVPAIDTARAWREAARACLAAGAPPETIVWCYGDDADDLFAADGPGKATGSTATVPRSFVTLAESVAWHRDPERFARLYAVLWRLTHDTLSMDDQGDRELARLLDMAKAVRRCQHKMKAFVRFRDLGLAESGRRAFAAWFEPTHYTLEPTAPFFAGRFGDMNWHIVTPHRTALFRNGTLCFGAGAPRPALPDDATEELWATYFRSIFNPARLKVKAMRSQMPQKYWHNMPETRLIPELVATAGERTRAMREAAPTLPPLRAMRMKAHAAHGSDEEPVRDLERLRREAQECTRCALHCQATQAVMGEGPPDARLMVVGEQPGDQEDIVGRPFVGPAGRLFDEICVQAGVDRESAFVTNAVKHFKFEPRGKRRLHRRPTSGEIAHCRWWLDAELALVRPGLIVALGATAAEAVTGDGGRILQRRGGVERTVDGIPVLLTVHPSYLLRLPDARIRKAETERFRRDLAQARDLLEAMTLKANNPGGMPT